MPYSFYAWLSMCKGLLEGNISLGMRVDVASMLAILNGDLLCQGKGKTFIDRWFFFRFDYLSWYMVIADIPLQPLLTKDNTENRALKSTNPISPKTNIC